jgi:cysteinyl-tRNA synthetase
MILYNTLSRKKEELVPIHNGKVGIYTCGPTVYWYAHIGNLRSFLFADVLCRALEFNGYEIKHALNITDVGHLTSDMDDGDDKMIVAMRREGKSSKDISEFYTSAFMHDLERLNIKPANFYPKATEHIPEQIEMITALEKNDLTYKTSDGIYFDTSKMGDYGMLSGQRASEKKAGARVEMGEKRNATDFALWKFSPKASTREMEWNSPWGKGFPGWHIECSAMAAKYLDVPFDIHTGGIDHIAVHHENEIAQTRGALGELEANIWLHNEFLTVNNGKMSKSLGNLYTLDDLISRNYDPLAFRYLCLEAHYRSKMNFTFDALDGAQNALNKLRETVRAWDAPSDFCGAGGHLLSFKDAINNDLNTSEALAVVHDLVLHNIPSSGKSAAILQMDRVLGLRLDECVGKPIDVPRDVQNLVSEREKARKEKKWGLSDELRKRIAELGFAVEDTDDGTKVKKL